MSDNNTEDTQAAVIGGTPTSSEHYHRFLCFVEGPPIDKDFYINKNSNGIPQSSLSSISGGITTISDTRFGGTAQYDLESGSTDTFDVIYGRSERYTDDNRSSLSSLTDIAPSNDRGRFHFGRKGKRFQAQLDDIEDSPPRPLSGSPWYIQSQQDIQPPPVHSFDTSSSSTIDIPEKKLITSRSHLDLIIAQPPPMPPLQQNRLPSLNNRRVSCESTAGISEGFLTYVQEEIRNTSRKRRMILASVFVIFFICIIAITAAAVLNHGEDEGNANASFQIVEQQPQEHNTTGLDMTNDEGDLTVLDISDAVSAFDEDAVSSSNEDEDTGKPNTDVAVTTNSTVQSAIPSSNNSNQVGDADVDATVMTNPTIPSDNLFSNEMNEIGEPSSPATAVEAVSSLDVETSIGQASTLATTSSQITTTKPPSNPDWLQQISVLASLDPPSVSPTPKATGKPSVSPSSSPSTSPATKAPSTNSPTMSPTKNKCISRCEKDSNDQYRNDRDELILECMEKDAKKCDKDEKKCKRDCKREVDKKEQEIMEKINSDELKCKTTCLNNNSDDTQLTVGRESNVLVYQTDRSTPDEFWMNMNDP